MDMGASQLMTTHLPVTNNVSLTFNDIICRFASEIEGSERMNLGTNVLEVKTRGEEIAFSDTTEGIIEIREVKSGGMYPSVKAKEYTRRLVVRTKELYGNKNEMIREHLDDLFHFREDLYDHPWKTFAVLGYHIDLDNPPKVGGMEVRKSTRINGWQELGDPDKQQHVWMAELAVLKLNF